MAEAITLHIEGMTCTSCAEHVQQALTNVPGVRAASVSSSPASGCAAAKCWIVG